MIVFFFICTTRSWILAGTFLNIPITVYNFPIEQKVFVFPNEASFQELHFVATLVHFLDRFIEIVNCARK